MTDDPMQEHNLHKVEEYVQLKRHENYFFFKNCSCYFLMDMEPEHKQAANHSNTGCTVICTARRGGQKSYSAGLVSELLINYLGSPALFKSMPTQMWSEIS